METVLRAPSHVAALIAALIAAALLITGCGGDADQAAVPSAAPATMAGASPAGPASSDPATTVDPAAVAAARTLIDGALLDDPASLDALGAVRFDDGAPEAAAQALADGVTGDARWAATWTYASAGTDPGVLRPVLEEPDPSLRALAAAALIAWGDPAGIPALAALVELPDRLAGSYPPTSVGEFATGTLARFVAGPGIAPDSTSEEQAAAWSAWLAEHDPATLGFDPETGIWSAR